VVREKKRYLRMKGKRVLKIFNLKGNNLGGIDKKVLGEF
jgi:hypothetical protein